MAADSECLLSSMILAERTWSWPLTPPSQEKEWQGGTSRIAVNNDNSNGLLDEFRYGNINEVTFTLVQHTMGTYKQK
jgi:hypothetical protein